MINYLRVSVTDECNLHCIYCKPKFKTSKGKKLSDNEFLKIIETASKIGIDTIRITGGEPLQRKNLTQFIARISNIKTIKTISLTTNGTLLHKYVKELKDAGISRINISLDTTRPDQYKFITGKDELNSVLKSIKETIKLGIRTQINSVLFKNINEDQIIPLSKLSIDLQCNVRFIEHIPIGPGCSAYHEQFIPNNDIKSAIEKHFGTLIEIGSLNGRGPAKYFKIKNSAGTIGFISFRSDNFCDTCNKLRLTCDGKLRLCLMNSYEVDLKPYIHNSEKLYNAIKDAIAKKSECIHNKESDDYMFKIGG